MKAIAFSIVIVALANSLFAQSSEKQMRDSLMFVRDDQTRFNLLVKLSQSLKTRAHDSSVLLATQSLSLAGKMNNDKNVSRAHRLLGRLHYNQGDYLKAIEDFNISLQYSLETKDSSIMSAVFDDLSRSYRKIGDYKKAIEYNHRAMEIVIATNDKPMIGTLTNNLALILTDNGEDSLGLEYYKKSLSASVETNDTSGIILSYNNLGVQYDKMKNKQQAQMCYLQALALTEANEEAFINVAGVTYDNIASMLVEQGDYQKALKYLQKALAVETKTGVKVYEAEELISLAEFYITIKDYPSGLKYANEALAISERVKSADLRLTVSQNLSILYENLKQFDKSLFYLKLFNKLKDSIHSVDKRREIANVSARYELNKKEQQEKLEAQRKLLAQNRRNNLQFLLMGTVVIGVFIFIFAIRGKIKERRLDYLTFIAFLLLFEFLMTLVEPRLLNLTDNEPLLILLGNTIIAGIIAPVHSLVERKFKTLLIVRKESLSAGE